MARPSRSEYTAKIRQLIGELRDDMDAGRLEHGDYLPSELELGRIYGLSKESVRKALDVLVEEGRIVKIRRVGNRVQMQRPGTGNLTMADSAADRTDIPVRVISADGQKLPPVGSLEGQSGSGDDRIFLTLACYPSLLKEVQMQEVVSAFEAEHPGIGIRLITTPFPLDFAEHGMADVVTLTGWDTWKLKARAPLMSALDTAPSTAYAHPLLAEAFRDAGGRVAAAPFVFSPVVLCYNREHFRNAGMSEPGEGWTWYTLLKNSRVLAERNGVAGFAAHMQSVNRWPVFLLQNEFRFVPGEGKRAADNPALWDSLRIARELIHRQGGPVRLWTESDSDVERWFEEGRVSIVMTTCFGLNRLQDAPLDYGVSGLPSLRTDATLLLATGLGVSRNSAYPEEARKLVDWLCGETAQTDIRRKTLTLPAHPDALSLTGGLEGNRPAVEPDYSRMWDRFRLYADLDLGTGVLETLREELKAYWSQLEDEAEASERLEALLGQ